MIVTGEVRKSGGVACKRDGVDRATPTSVAKPLRPCAFAGTEHLGFSDPVNFNPKESSSRF